MFHLRLVTPPDVTEEALVLLADHDAVANLVVLRGAALSPAGDLILCDAAREGVNEVLVGLRDLDVHRRGSIALDDIDVSVSDAAEAAERRSPGYGSDAAVWEVVDARVRDESLLSAGFVIFVVLAALIAVVGLLEDAPILIVGAMVVGPEFGPIAGLSVGLFKRRASRVRVAARTLLVGAVAGVAASFLGTLLADLADLVPERFSAHEQELTGFVVEPSALSFVVALLAGAAGMLSLTQARTGALIGVLISVTTIPAVAAIGVAAALGDWTDAKGAILQLGLNVVALVLASVATLWVQRATWPRRRRVGA